MRSWENGNSKTSYKTNSSKKKLILADRLFSLSSMTSGVYKLMDEEQCRFDFITGTEGTEQYKSYLQKRKPPRVVKSLASIGSLKKEDKGYSKVAEESKRHELPSPKTPKFKLTGKSNSKINNSSKVTGKVKGSK